jgi:hypothetical protein
MSGPALRQLHAHRAIHEGGLSGAIGKTEDMMDLLRKGELEVARQAADDLIDYWKTRVISHADAEESGMYLDIAKENPELQEAITMLTRDHDLIRIIVADIEEILEEEGLGPEIFQRFYSLIVVNEIHSREEERLLFAE